MVSEWIAWIDTTSGESHPDVYSVWSKDAGIGKFINISNTTGYPANRQSPQIIRDYRSWFQHHVK
jgi:hypothetical protein